MELMLMRLHLYLPLLAFLSSVRSLTIKGMCLNGTELFRYNNDNAGLAGRSEFLPQDEANKIEGHLILPGTSSDVCTLIPAVDVNLTLIAFINFDFEICGTTIEQNIYKAGYAAMLVYAPSSSSSLDPVTRLPQAMFTNKQLDTYLENILGKNYTYKEDIVLELWDDSTKKLERLFIIFGSILLAAILLAIALFCCTFICRAAVYKWRTRGLSRWQVRRLPRRRYRKAKETTETCSICLEDFKEGSTVRVLPCDHIFHPKCIDEWLRNWNRTCPLCKTKIKRSKGARAPVDPDETSQLLSEDRQSTARPSINEEAGYGATDTRPELVQATPPTSPPPASPGQERMFLTPAVGSDIEGETLSYQTADEGSNVVQHS